MSKGIDIFSLRGKKVMLTGATGHLGAGIALSLAEAGAHVFVNSRSLDRSEALVETLLAEGLSAEIAVFDVTDQSAVNTFFSDIKGCPLNVLINNAYLGGAGCIESSVAEDYAASYEVTVLAAHNLLKAALPSLRKAVKETGDASVINVSSMYGMVSPDQRLYGSTGVNPPFYGAAKAAMLQWTRYAACEFGKESIRVNAISPGPFPSLAMQAANPDFIEKLAAKVPMRRIGASDEIKGPMLFLASSAASFVNGANVVVDGGWTCW